MKALHNSEAPWRGHHHLRIADAKSLLSRREARALPGRVNAQVLEAKAPVDWAVRRESGCGEGESMW